MTTTQISTCTQQGCKNEAAPNRKTCQYHLDWIKAFRDKMRAENPDYWRESEERRIRKLRKQAFTLLGGECVRCGNRDPEVLTIDHINGAGPDEKGRGVRMYRRYLDPNYPIHQLQLLCANCHLRKTRRERGCLPWDD